MPNQDAGNDAGALMQPKPAGPETISPLIIISPIVISIVMAGLLGFVYGITKEPIAESKRKEEQAKLQQVMPAFDNDPLSTKQELSDAVTIYTGEQGGAFSGYGVKSSVETGYSGHFSVMLGVNPDGSVNKVQVLESSETPGLGSKASLPSFIDQFNGQMPGEFTFEVVKDGGDVDAITGATITSRAVCDCVQGGLNAIAELPPLSAQSEEAATPESGAEVPPTSVEEPPITEPAGETGAVETESAPADEPSVDSENAGQAEPEPKPEDEPAGGE